MEKNKAIKIVKNLFVVLLVIVVAFVLVLKSGIVDVETLSARIKNPDYFWQTEPFGDADMVYQLRATTDKSARDEYGIGFSFKNKNSSKLSGESLSTLDEIRNKPYDPEYLTLNAAENIDGICYLFQIVPSDCEYVEINGERFDIQSGKINTPEGKIEFKYFTAAYKSLNYYDEDGTVIKDELIAYDDKGEAHNCNESHKEH